MAREPTPVPPNAVKPLPPSAPPARKFPALAVVVEPMNYMSAAMAPAVEGFRNHVMIDTWGHLAPEAGRTYAGEIVFAYGEWRDVVPIRSSFADLPDSPWFFEQMQDFLTEYCRTKGTEGEIYRFVGTYRMFKNGNHRFSGTTVSVTV